MDFFLHVLDFQVRSADRYEVGVMHLNPLGYAVFLLLIPYGSVVLLPGDRSGNFIHVGTRVSCG